MTREREWFVPAGAAAFVVLVIGVLAWSVIRSEPEEWLSRTGPALAWTGDRLFVYGGYQDDPREVLPSIRPPLNSAALIDPATGDVDVLPEPPFEPALQARAAVVVVGDDVVVLGYLCEVPDPESSSGWCDPGTPAAATYSLADDSWSELPLPQETTVVPNLWHEALGTTTDGRAVFQLGVDLGADESITAFQFWTYRPADGRWAKLEHPGVRIEQACLAGDTVVVGTGRLRHQEGTADESDPYPSGGGDRYPSTSIRYLDLGEAGGSWVASTDAPRPPGLGGPEVTCLDDRALLHDGVGRRLQLHGFGEPGDWTVPGRPPPPDPGELRQEQGATDDELLLLNHRSTSVAYDPEAERWRVLDPGPPTYSFGAVWTGEVFALWPPDGGRLPITYDPG